MTNKPTEKEISHALFLLKEFVGWDGKRAVLPIDPVCQWQRSCGKPLHSAVVLRGGDEVSIVVFCEYHTNCMTAAIEYWRSVS